MEWGVQYRIIHSCVRVRHRWFRSYKIRLIATPWQSPLRRRPCPGMCLALLLGVPEENLRIALPRSWMETSSQPCWWQTWISLKRPFRGQDEGKPEEARPCPKGWRARSDVQRWSKIRFVSKVFLCVFIWTQEQLLGYYLLPWHLPPCCLASHGVANRRCILFCLTVVLKTSTLFPLLIQQIFARCSCCLGRVRCRFYIGKSLWSQPCLPMIRACFACAKTPGIFVAQADW